MTVISSKLTTNMGAGGHGDIWTAVGHTDTTVYEKRDQMVKGVATSGKTYCRFRPESRVFFSWKGPRLRIYRKRWEKIRGTRRYRIQFEDTTDYFLRDGRIGISPELKEALLNFTGKDSLTEVWLADYPLMRDLIPAKDVTPFLTRTNIQDFTRDFFGPSRYRKDLVRGVARRGWVVNGGMQNLVLAKAFAPMIPTDWIARKFLDAPEPTMMTLASHLATGADRGYREIRQMLRTATPKQVRRLWGADSFPSLSDTMRLWREIRKVDDEYRLESVSFTDWKTLHDQLAIDQRRIHTRNRPVKYEGKAAEVIGKYFSLDDPRQIEFTQEAAAPADTQVATLTYEIIGTPDTHTLLEWGSAMANCIGSYQDDAVYGDSLLYAVLKEGDMIANVEVAPSGKLRQLVGKYNAKLPQVDHDRIVEAFQRAWPNCADGHYIGKVGAVERRDRGVEFRQVMLADAGAPRRIDLDDLPGWVGF